MTHVPAPESTESDAGPESGPKPDRDAQDAREARYGQACGDPGASTRRLPNENVSRWAGRAAMQCADAELAPLRARVAELEADVAQVRASWERECGNLELAHRQIERLHNAMSGHRRAMEALIAKAENRDPATVAATGEPFRNWVLTSELRAALAAAGPAASDGEGATREATDLCATHHAYWEGVTDTVCDFILTGGVGGGPCRRPASPVVAPSATKEGGWKSAAIQAADDWERTNESVSAVYAADGGWAIRKDNIDDLRAELSRTAQKALEGKAAQVRLAALGEAVIDLCWKATPMGETADGDVHAYILPKGTVHRLIGVAQSAGISASFRASPAPDAVPSGEATDDAPTKEA